jgi:aspartate racemase
LHIAEAVAAEAVGRRFRRLGLTGTRYLVDSEVYPEKLKPRNLEFVRPTPEESSTGRTRLNERTRCRATALLPHES